MGITEKMYNDLTDIIKEEDIEYLFAGDLLNQIISAGFSARDFDIPFLEVILKTTGIAIIILL